MDETLVDTADREAFTHQVVKRLRDQVEPSQAEGAEHFARLFFHHFALSDWQGRQWHQVTGAIAWLWQFVHADLPLPRVRVFNPTDSQDQWWCPHTVVAIHQRDMPFLVDSVRIELASRNIPIHSIKSTPFDAKRRVGQLEDVGPVEHKHLPAEALIYLEVGAVTDPEAMEQMEQSLREVLAQVEQVVSDFGPLVERALEAADGLEPVRGDKTLQSVVQTEDFLRWLASDHFTFLAYAEFDLTERDGKRVLVENRDRRLGLFDNAGKIKIKTLDDANEGVGRFYLSPNVVAFSKSPQRSRVHRHAYPDYVVVKRFNEQGEVCGEARFLGLYTSTVYTHSPSRIPLLQEKVDELYQRIGLNVWSHEGKALEQVIETYPRDELFQSSRNDLFRIINGIMAINERYQVRLFARRDHFGQFVSFLLYVPRDLFSSQLRERIQRHITEKIGALDEEFNTYFSESILARVHLVFRVSKHSQLNFDEAELEREIGEMARSWEDRLFEVLQTNRGEEQARRILNHYRNRFSPAYQEHYRPERAMRDIDTLEALAGDAIAMDIFADPDGGDLLRLKIFHRQSPLALSDVIPVLENMGLRVVSEHPFRIYANGEGAVWLHDFALNTCGTPLARVIEQGDAIKSAFAAVWQGRAENDPFNQLTISTGIGWRYANMLRCYANYMRQTRFYYSLEYIANALANQPSITRQICDYFSEKFQPGEAGPSAREKTLKAIETEIYAALEQVPNLSEDRIIRHLLALLGATVRVNFYQPDASPYLAIKLTPRKLADVPEPRPLYEIFVFSPRMEGIHLRGGPVARGGLRWSDRLEDYRTEVLGLVKAQQVKNAVIVPSGAKGGFVCKQAAGMDRAEKAEEGVTCYKQFISALLDLTDNLEDGQIVPPTCVVRHDGDDPYFVVAADKGTATFSDTANAIALDRGFWLGDAFASGGSQGYDHKGMGITARGAWVSVRRHFQQWDHDVQKTPFTAIGIGDMGGDVFGNGMLLSPQTQLVAAFNHLHIFIDPNPDIEASFKERERLFQADQSGWHEYDTELISDGGGVFERSVKSIEITGPMRERLGIDADSLTPNELIHELLKAPVDLIWNGGVGTYVKGASESHADVGDKANDALRVDGGQLRARVFGEGGNLGMTQLGRVEFARAGGACNTDFIDNAAGVDCSDHEVNIKILLDELIKRGDMDRDQRNEQLKAMTEDVARAVLVNNDRQTRAIGLAASDALARSAEYRRFISDLEHRGRLDRKLEFLPDDEVLAEREAAGCGLTRPELSVLISYAKVGLKEDLATDAIGQDPAIEPLCEKAFPPVLAERYPDALYNHRLRREIIATQLANEIVNLQGCTFVQRMSDAAGVDAPAVARAYVLAREVGELDSLWADVEALDFAVPIDIQRALLKHLMRRIRRLTRWFLRNRRGELDISQHIEQFCGPLKTIRTQLPELLSDEAREDWRTKVAEFAEQGVDTELAEHVVSPGYLYSGVGIVDVALARDRDPVEVAELYFALVERLRLSGFAAQLSDARVDSYWQAMARETYMDDLESQVRKLTLTLVDYLEQGDVRSVIEQWAERHTLLLERWQAMVTQAQSAAGTDYAMFAVALRELLDLVQVSEHSH